MEKFAAIWERAAKRKGGAEGLQDLMPELKSAGELKKIPDDRWLSGMTKRIFQAGFVWKVIENKWDGFEEAFHGFDPNRLSFMSPDEMDSLVSDTRIIRNGQKIKATLDNAVFVSELAKEHGSAAAFFADWPLDNFVELLSVMKKRGSRLGGVTGPYFLRFMGKDSFILNTDMVVALIHAGVIEKNPTSKKDLLAVQTAFNRWHEETGIPYAHISRILACSIDAS